MEQVLTTKIVKPEHFKASAHSVGDIMGVKGLNKGGQDYAKEWYLKTKYDRKPDFFSKYVEKGLAVEQEGISMLSQHLNKDLYKNDEYFNNNFVHGCPDVLTEDTVYDIKSSWDLFSFPYFEKDIPNKDYFFQLQAYMWLTGLKKAALVYCLINTPQPLVDQELKKLYYQSGGHAEDWTPDHYEHLYSNYRFDDIPFKDRIRVFEVDRDDKVIALMQSRVMEAREYLKSVI